MLCHSLAVVVERQEGDNRGEAVVAFCNPHRRSAIGGEVDHSLSRRNCAERLPIRRSAVCRIGARSHRDSGCRVDAAFTVYL